MPHLIYRTTPRIQNEDVDTIMLIFIFGIFGVQAHRVAIGGLVFKVPGANFTAFAAEQRIADGTLVTRQTTAGGATFTTTTQLHPQLQVLETVFSWSPGNGSRRTALEAARDLSVHRACFCAVWVKCITPVPVGT